VGVARAYFSEMSTGFERDRFVLFGVFVLAVM
jgi:hypothetical protein